MVVYILFVLNPEYNNWELLGVFKTEDAAKKMEGLVKGATKITTTHVLGD